MDISTKRKISESLKRFYRTGRKAERSSPERNARKAANLAAVKAFTKDAAEKATSAINSSVERVKKAATTVQQKTVTEDITARTRANIQKSVTSNREAEASHRKTLGSNTRSEPKITASERLKNLSNEAAYYARMAKGTVTEKIDNLGFDMSSAINKARYNVRKFLSKE